jgi:hypothetical protein
MQFTSNSVNIMTDVNGYPSYHRPFDDVHRFGTAQDRNSTLEDELYRSSHINSFSTSRWVNPQFHHGAYVDRQASRGDNRPLHGRSPVLEHDVYVDRPQVVGPNPFTRCKGGRSPASRDDQRSRSERSSVPISSYEDRARVPHVLFQPQGMHGAPTLQVHHHDGYLGPSSGISQIVSGLSRSNGDSIETVNNILQERLSVSGGPTPREPFVHEGLSNTQSSHHNSLNEIGFNPVSRGTGTQTRPSREQFRPSIESSGCTARINASQASTHGYEAREGKPVPQKLGTPTGIPVRDQPVKIPQTNVIPSSQGPLPLENPSFTKGSQIQINKDQPRCMKYNCNQRSVNNYNRCFCSEECQDIVFEKTHSAGIVLIGIKNVPYSVILKSRMDAKKSDEEWEAPGGVRERNLSETAIGCAIRECVEETGMVLKVDKMAKYLMKSPMVAMSIKNGTQFTGIYHLAIYVHISDFNDINMHTAWMSRMDRYTRKELDKWGQPAVRSDCVDMKFSAALDLNTLWQATTNHRSAKHPRKNARVVSNSAGSPESKYVVLCYRDYWSISRIQDRRLLQAIVSMPTLEQLGIWDQTFIS